MVTIEYNSECNRATITIPNQPDYAVVVTDKETDEFVNSTHVYEDDAYKIEVEFQKETVLEIVLLDSAGSYVDSYPIILNCKSLKCLMHSNKLDVVKQLKSGNISNHTNLLDALNRVTIANTKLKRYDLVVEGLSYLSSLCDNDNCESC